MSPLTEEQQRLILRLSHPLPRRLRDEFYRRIGAEIAGLSTLGDGALYRLAAQLQKQMLDPPLLDGVED